MQALGRRYVQYVNRFYKRSGALWEGRQGQPGYPLKYYRYIELNPVRAGMVRHPRGYPWSSHGSMCCRRLTRWSRTSRSIWPWMGMRHGGCKPMRHCFAPNWMRRRSVKSERPRGVGKFWEAIVSGTRLNRHWASDVRRKKTGRSKRGSGGLDGEQGEFGF